MWDAATGVLLIDGSGLERRRLAKDLQLRDECLEELWDAATLPISSKL